jgi:hypothetical protein
MFHEYFLRAFPRLILACGNFFYLFFTKNRLGDGGERGRGEIWARGKFRDFSVLLGESIIDFCAPFTHFT